LNPFEFSERLLDDLERVQGASGRGRGRVDHAGNQRLGKALFAHLHGPGMGDAGKGGRSSSRAERSQAAAKSLSRVAKKAPQVVFKITSRVHGAANTVSSFTYVSRVSVSEKDDIPLLTSEGKELTSATEMLALARDWQAHAEAGNDRRKGATALAMVYSMPPGTDPEKVREAVINLAEEDFADRRWVAALHTDEAHPHVHVVIAMRDNAGRRFNPDRQFIQHNRERFAEMLREVGIEADASRSVARGYPPKGDKLPVQKVRERGEEPRVDAARVATLDGKDQPSQAYMAKRERAFSKTVANAEAVKETYRKAIDELRSHGGAEQSELAKSLEKFVSEMPEPRSARADILERLREGNALPERYEKDPELERLKARVQSRSDEAKEAALARLLKSRERLQGVGKADKIEEAKAAALERLKASRERLQGQSDPNNTSANERDPKVQRDQADAATRALNKTIEDQQRQHDRDRAREQERERDKDKPRDRGRDDRSR
jgi:hypothetical protein|tara:strand:- start:99 stop:1577 length:1479 start_codon:yes stop_codon:yes gene_type:complete